MPRVCRCGFSAGLAPARDGVFTTLPFESAFRIAPRPHFFFLSHIFSMAGSKQIGEGDESRAFIGRSADPLICFQDVNALSQPRLPHSTPESRFFLLSRFFLQVRAR
jgi:hypothetical protein